MTRYSIELDCPPGNPRPEQLINAVLDNTPFELSDFETAPPFFGHQRWTLINHVKDAQFVAYQDIFKQRITELYESGTIRYGSW